MKPCSFLFVDTYYPAFLDYFYKNHRDIVNKNYKEHKSVLMDECFGTSNFYCLNLAKLGYKADNVIANNEILQRQWAGEQGIDFKDFPNLHPVWHFSFLKKIIQKKPRFYYWIKEKLNRKSWVYQILMAQIKGYQPDVLYILDIGFISPSFLKEIRKYVKIIVGQIACPLPPNNYFKSYDLILSSLPHYVEKFRKMGIKSEYLKLAFEPSILKRVSKSKKQYDVTHIGGYGPIHNERNEISEKVAQKIKIDFWGYGIENLKKGSPILKNYYGESWGIDMYNILYNSKITLTKHITKVAGNYANNARLYEATGCGTLLLVDKKDNLNEIFEVGREVVAYKNSEDLINKIKYYLTHESEREKIAKAGQARTLREHTYEKRINELLNILEKYL